MLLKLEAGTCVGIVLVPIRVGTCVKCLRYACPPNRFASTTAQIDASQEEQLQVFTAEVTGRLDLCWEETYTNNKDVKP